MKRPSSSAPSFLILIGQKTLEKGEHQRNLTFDWTIFSFDLLVAAHAVLSAVFLLNSANGSV